MSETSAAVHYELRDAVAVVSIDRPQARNAVNGEVARGIERALDRAEGEDGARVVVLTGGGSVFCAGADLKEIGAGRAVELATERGGFAGLVRRERELPLIAAVEGPALAGGTEIVLAADLVVASRGARFGLPEVKRGLIAGGGGLFRLPRKLPLALALEYGLTGDAMPAEIAHSHGLVNVLCEEGEALTEALALAARIAANAPLAVRETRALMLAAAGAEDEAAWPATLEAFERMLASEDVSEGVAAFAEKRDPVWKGR